MSIISDETGKTMWPLKKILGITNPVLVLIDSARWADGAKTYYSIEACANCVELLTKQM